jgi:formamidopyrimidine-DNA glycosylase
MPELPEVETILRSLQPVLLGKTITQVQVLDRRLRWPVATSVVKRWLTGATIKTMFRRAKYLFWQMDNGATMMVHLGMSGRLGYCRADEPREKHTHVVLTLSDGGQVRYRDPRRFGCIEVIPAGGRSRHLDLDALGVEPLSSDFTVAYAMAVFAGSQRPVKVALMDGRMVSGVGNIYANEALFQAGIAPGRSASSLDAKEWERVVGAVQSVLQNAIAKGGTTLNDFRNARGEPGFFQMDLAVYDRAGESCCHCGRSIERMVLQGRSTYFCPQCQK